MIGEASRVCPVLMSLIKLRIQKKIIKQTTSQCTYIIYQKKKRKMLQNNIDDIKQPNAKRDVTFF